MSNNPTSERRQRDYTTVAVDHDILDKLHDRKGRGETLNDVIRNALERTE